MVYNFRSNILRGCGESLIGRGTGKRLPLGFIGVIVLLSVSFSLSEKFAVIVKPEFVIRIL